MNNDYGLRPQLARDLPLYRDAINKRHITIIDQFIEKAKELGLSEELQKLIEIKKYSEQYIAEMDFDSRMGYIKDIMDRYKKGYDSSKIDKYKLPKYTFPECIEMYKYKNFELMENALQELEIAPEITSDCSVSQVFESQVAM